MRKPLPSIGHLGDAPWWVWIGGLLGAFYVAGSIFSAPKLGAAPLIAAVVAGQSFASVSSTSSAGSASGAPLTPGRVVGVVLVAEASLVRVF